MILLSSLLLNLSPYALREEKSENLISRIGKEDCQLFLGEIEPTIPPVFVFYVRSLLVVFVFLYVV